MSAGDVSVPLTGIPFPAKESNEPHRAYERAQLATEEKLAEAAFEFVKTAMSEQEATSAENLKDTRFVRLSDGDDHGRISGAR